VNLGDDLDPAAIVELAAALARRAADHAPRRQRRFPRASAKAVEIIVRALHRPVDPASQMVARKLAPSLDCPGFMRVAELVWAAAIPKASKASPERSIRAYVREHGVRTREVPTI
jgi:hypothetical protein